MTETREHRVGKHLMDTARSLGWKDDGEGAFEFITRITYEQAQSDFERLKAMWLEALREELKSVTHQRDKLLLEREERSS